MLNAVRHILFLSSSMMNRQRKENEEAEKRGLDKEALDYEMEFIRKTVADIKKEMNSFIQIYFENKKNELKVQG